MQAVAATSPIHTLPPCDAVTQYLLRLGDSALLLGHRLSEWAGHAPTLEEDIALSNVGLDHIGAARLLLSEAGGRMSPALSEDDLAYWREPAAWRGYSACALPNSGIEKGQHARDFGFTIVRNALYAAYTALLWEKLCTSTDVALAGIAAKCVKEARYHYLHASGWVQRLGDGTALSQAKVQTALNALWPYCNEWFADDAVAQACSAAGVAPLHSSLSAPWDAVIGTLLGRSGLSQPSPSNFASKGSQGLAGEHLGYLLAEMQSVTRAHPGASW